MAGARDLNPYHVLPTLTPAEYLERERRSLERHEYIDGLVFMMAGARENHVLIVQNVCRPLGNQLEARPCKICILISQYTPRIERFTRQSDGGWLLRTFDRQEDQVELTAIDCVLALEMVYQKVTLEL